MAMEFFGTEQFSAKMLSFVSTFLLACFAISTAALPAAAPVLPAKGAVTVASIDVDLDGSGCRPGDVSVTLSPDNAALTLIFDNFAAADGCVCS